MSWGKSIEQISKLKHRNLLYFKKFFAKYLYCITMITSKNHHIDINIIINI